MIFTDRTITVRKGESRIDEPIVVYRGDYELEVRFTILNSRFKFMSGTNMIESEKSSYGQLAILTPYGGNIFSDIVRCNDGSVTFVLTADMLNQIEEVGLYSFQIRLMDYNKESRVSIPPIEYGIEVREPIASEDHDNSVNNAIVGYSIAKVVDPKKEKVGDTFDESGNYNKTKWETGDRISEGKLNKIEDAIDKVNENEVNSTASLSKRIDNNFNVLDSIKANESDVFLKNNGININDFDEETRRTFLDLQGIDVNYVLGYNAVKSMNIANGQVTAEKLANSSVLFNKVADDFMCGDVINDNNTLRSTIKTGLYLVVGCSETPNVNNAYILSVKRCKLADGRYYIEQNIIDTVTNECYSRFFAERGSVPSVFTQITHTTHNIKFNDINDHMLSSQVMITTNEELLTTVKNGTYLVSNCSDLPNQQQTYYMDVINYIFDGRIFTRQTLHSTVGEQYYRIVDSKYPSVARPFVKISPKKPLEGKRAVFFGDSVMEFGTIPTKVSEITGATTYNVGFGGCRMTTTLDDNYNEMSMSKLAETITTGDFSKLENASEILARQGDDNRHIVATLKSIDFSKIDIIVVAYGTNDLSIANLGENDSYDTSTFKGAINNVIKLISTKYPHIKILFCTPIYRARMSVGDGQDADVTPNPHGLYLKQFVDAMIEVTAINHIPCQDMYRNCGINKYNHVYYLSDGLHPNEKGDNLIAEKYSSFIINN